MARPVARGQVAAGVRNLLHNGGIEYVDKVQGLLSIDARREVYATFGWTF